MSNIYPIQPTFITRIKEYGPDDPDGLNDFDLNSHGVLGMDNTQGFLAVLAHDKYVNSSVTLFEFLPNYLRNNPDLIKKENAGLIKVPEIKCDSFFGNLLDDRFIIRTDNINHFKLKRCCSYFRDMVKNDKDEEGTCFCDVYDLRVSLFAIKELHKDGEFKKLQDEISRFNEDKEEDKIIFVKATNDFRPFFYYQCPISGFYEAVFPIFHEKVIIGCIMVGEIIYKNIDKTKVSMKFENFIERNHILDKDTEKQYKIKRIRDFSEYDFSYYENQKGTEIPRYFSTENELEYDLNFRVSIEEHLENIERRIRKRVGHISQRYVSTSFLKIKNSFEEEAFSKNSLNKLNILSFSKIIEKALKEIVKYFPNEDGFIRIFMSDKSGNEKILKIIAVSDREELKEKNIRPEDYSYDLSFIDPEIIEKNRNVSNDDSEFTDYEKLITLEKGIRYKGDDLQFELKNGSNIIRYYPTLAKGVYFIIWQRYAYEFINNHNQFDLFKLAMFDFYRTIAANYAALWGSHMKKLLEDAIRISAHETNQIMPVIVDSLEENFKNDLRVDDILNQLQLLRLGLTAHSFIFKEIDFARYQKTEINIRSLINRFGNNFYKKRLNFRKLHFAFESEKNEKICVLGNYILIEHALNNLIDNAVKYSYRGTNIIVQLEINKQDLIIHIKNCGPKVPNYPNVFDLYTRGDESRHIEGNGIGLFLCKKIIEAHGWKISFNSKKLSDYDIACLACYIQQPNFYKVDDEKFLILSKKIKNSEIEKYVSKGNVLSMYNPGSVTFQLEYARETWLNDFYITIENKYSKT